MQIGEKNVENFLVTMVFKKKNFKTHKFKKTFFHVSSLENGLKK
jgi:hypothetical protein